MSKFQFDDTETSGIWWSTNVSIRDLCVELQADTTCNDKEIVDLLRSIADTLDVQRVKQMFQSAEPIAFRPLHQHPQTLTASDDLRASFESIARHIDRFYTEPRTLTPEQALPQTIKNIARRLGAYTD